MIEFYSRAPRFLLLAILLVLAIYTLHSGDYFILDSLPVIRDNPVLLQFDPGQLDHWRLVALATDTGPLGRPLSMLSFAIDQTLFGTSSAYGLRISNALIHCLNATLLAGLLRCLLMGSPLLSYSRREAESIACLAAVLWLLHPLHVSTVLYTVQRMALLPATFTFATLWWVFHQRTLWLRRSPCAAQISTGLMVLCAGTAAAALSKENGLLLPWLAGVVELCLYRGRLRGGRRKAWDIALLLLFVVPLVLGLWLVLSEHPLIWSGYSHSAFTLPERVLTQLRVLWTYLGWLAWPMPSSLGLFHDGVEISRSLLEWPVLLAGASWFGVAMLAWVQRDRFPLLALALAWYLMAHALESSVIRLELVFEHRNYIPSAAVCLLFAGLLWQGSSRLGDRRALPIALVSLALLAALFMRSAWWREETLLAEYQYVNHPESPRAQQMLFGRYYSTGVSVTDPELQQRYLASARELVFRAHQQAPDSLPPLVLLMHLDAMSSNAARVPEWRDRLLVNLSGRNALDAADIAHLNLFVDCVLAGTCPAPAQGMDSFLAELASRFGRYPLMAGLTVEQCLREEDLECALARASEIADTFPDSLEAGELVYRLNQMSGDSAGRMEAALQLYRRDRQRRLIHHFVAGNSR